MSGGGGSQQTSTEPWGTQKPFLRRGFEVAGGPFNERGVEGGLLDDPRSFYPGNTFAPISPVTREAQQDSLRRARQGSPVLDRGQHQAELTLQGDYLRSGNPFFQQMANQAAEPVIKNYQRAVQPGIDSAFGLAGRSGSGAHFNARTASQEQLADSLADMSSGLAYQNYGDERGRMQQMIGASPALA